MLKGDEEALIEAIVAGKSLGQCAAAAGVSISTVQRRRRDDDILAEVAARRAERREEAAGRLGSELAPAIERLTQLVGNEDPRVAIRAIGLLLGTAEKFVRTVDSAAVPCDHESTSRVSFS